MTAEVRLSLYYFVLATLWIVFSDSFLAGLPEITPAFITTAQTYKGALFVGVTSLMLYALLRVEFDRRRNVERQITARADHFQYLFHRNPQPMWIYDLQTLAFLEVNEAAVQRYGYTREEFLRMRVTDIRPPEEVPRLMADIGRDRPAYQDSGVWRHWQRDEQVIEVEVNSHQLTYEERDAVLVVAHDVTERERARRDLNRVKEHLQNIIDNAPLAIFLLDTEWRVQLWNPAAERIFGWTAVEIIGQPLPTIPAEHRGEAESLRREILAGRSFTGKELTRLRKDGSRVVVNLSTTPLRDEDGVAEIIVIEEDITDRKQMEAEVLDKQMLRTALDREIAMRQMRDRFVSMISHEFRNPLATIQSSNSMLQAYFERMQPDDRERHFERVESQVKRLTELLDDLLAVLRAELAEREFNPENVDLRAFCENLVVELEPRPDDRPRIQFKSDCKAVVQVQADTKLLYQALANLLTNALKYSSDDTMVRFELHCTGEEVDIRVIDRGIGIPAAEQERIFDAFHRAPNARAFPGTGLGLVIARQAVELHRGKMTLESVEGEGTAFTVSLPLHAAG